MEASRERQSKGGTDGVRDTPGIGSSILHKPGKEHWRVVTPNGYRTVRGGRSGKNQRESFQVSLLAL